MEKQKCKYERCWRDVPPNVVGGRRREYCNSTCRSAQSKLEAERASIRRQQEEEELRFQEKVGGLPVELHDYLRLIRDRESARTYDLAVECSRRAHALGAQSLIERYVDEANKAIAPKKVKV